MGRRFFLFLAILFFLVPSVRAQTTKPDQLRALATIMDELRTHYGMIKFKEGYAGVTFNQVEQKYRRLIESATTLEEASGLRPPVKRSVLPREEFRQLMIGLGNEFHDGHTNILRNAVGASTLGIRTASIGGKLFVVGFNPNYYVSAGVTEPIKVGDEVLEVDGRSVQDLSKENMLYTQSATYVGDEQFAMESVLNVSHRFFRAKPEGQPVVLKFQRGTPKDKEAPKIIMGTFHWLHNKKFQDMFVDFAKYAKPLEDLPYAFGQMGTRDSYALEGLKKLKSESGELVDIGAIVNSEIEKDKTKAKTKSAGIDEPKVGAGRVDETEETGATPADDVGHSITRLTALTFRHEGKTFGYLRIPSYSPGSVSEMKAEVLWLKRVVKYFEKGTDALILDQVSNSGGFVDYVSEFVRLFTHERTMNAVSIDIKLTDTLLREMEPGAGSTIYEEKLPTFAQSRLSRVEYDDLVLKFSRGQNWSGAVPYMNSMPNGLSKGTGKVAAGDYPTYSRPVLLLNDSRSASGGDFMPGIMQSNQRVLVMGDTSEGLGGPVYRSQAALPGSEMFLRCTMGYCALEDGTPLENRGVVPDIRRAIRPSDLKDGFKDYMDDVLKAALLYAQGKTASEIKDAVKPKKDSKTKAEEGDSTAKEVADIQSEIQKLAHDETSDLGLLVTKYEGLLSQIEGLETSKSKVLEAIEVQLPNVLLRRDLFLSSLFERNETLNRLAMMKDLTTFKKDPNMLRLIEISQKLMGKIKGLTEPNECRLRLASAKAP